MDRGTVTGQVRPLSRSEGPPTPMQTQPKPQAGSADRAPRRPGLCRRVGRWARAHPVRAALILGALAFTLLNILAFVHAHAMTHFVPGGERTKSPESLSF